MFDFLRAIRRCRWQRKQGAWWETGCTNVTWSDYGLGSPKSSGYRYCPTCGKLIDHLDVPPPTNQG